MALLRLPTERQKSVLLATTAIWLALFKCLLTGIMSKSELLAQAKSLFRAESEWGVHRVHGAEPVESLYVPAGQLRHWSSGALSLK